MSQLVENVKLCFKEHGEQRKEIERLRADIQTMREFGSIPAKDVAKFWLDREALHYRTKFDDGALTRLTSVIQRARIDGANAARAAETQ